jgi:CHAD domain-containing protein
MAFELKPDESLRKSLRRIARKQMDHALDELAGAYKGSRDHAVHETRKSFKKIRAILRFVRPEVGEMIYQEGNIGFRDAGRPLTEVRDAKIFVDTLDKLVEHFKEHVGKGSFAEVRKELQANLRAVRKRVLNEQNSVAVVTDAIQRGRKRIKCWIDVPDRWSSIGRGLKGVYRRASDAFREAVVEASVEKLHEWRKQTKYLRYQLEILHPLWPERMEELAREADRLGDLLGGDHDLAMLRQMLADAPGRFGAEGDVEILVALIDQRRAELEQAMGLGRRYFQDKPKDFTRRLKGYWKAWRSQTGSKQPDKLQSARA